MSGDTKRKNKNSASRRPERSQASSHTGGQRRVRPRPSKNSIVDEAPSLP
ncbi:unnamed protein product, partial [Ixodes persulcatus]